jgi:hypothetical protein
VPLVDCYDVDKWQIAVDPCRLAFLTSGKFTFCLFGVYPLVIRDFIFAFFPLKLFFNCFFSTKGGGGNISHRGKESLFCF